MKYLILPLFFILVSCGDSKKIQLPQSNISIIKDVQDYSPVYVFFEKKGKDTTIEVNRKNTIISTNWIFNVDKRLSLKMVIPEIIKLQEKKHSAKAHQNPLAQNYYSYSDSIHKNLAFITFTKVVYKLIKKQSNKTVYFTKSNEVVINSLKIDSKIVKHYLEKTDTTKATAITLCFDKNMSYGNYIQHKVFIQSLNLKNVSNIEFVY